MLRKWMTSILVAALLVVAVAGAAMAADEPATPPYGAGQCSEFVDEDGDGVCDNAAQNRMGNAGGRGVQTDMGPGMGRNRAAMPGNHAAMGANRGGMGAGRAAMVGGQGLNRSGNFVDADGDGQCDLWQDEDGDGFNDAAPRDGTGNRQQHGGRGQS